MCVFDSDDTLLGALADMTLCWMLGDWLKSDPCYHEQLEFSATFEDRLSRTIGFCPDIGGDLCLTVEGLSAILNCSCGLRLISAHVASSEADLSRIFTSLVATASALKMCLVLGKRRDGSDYLDLDHWCVASKLTSNVDNSCFSALVWNFAGSGGEAFIVGENRGEITGESAAVWWDELGITAVVAVASTSV